ncbi:MAG: hypothetical protein ACNI3H_07555 [Halarcobacter ebronensis]
MQLYNWQNVGADLKNKKGRTTVIPGVFDGEYFTPSRRQKSSWNGKCTFK